PAGGTISLNGVGLNPDPLDPDVFVTGHLFDPTGPVYSRSLVASYDVALTPLFSVVADFGGASRGPSINADRGGNAYIGARLGAPALPRPWGLKAGGGAIAWAFTVDLGNATAAPDNGMHSVALLGGMPPASGLYTVGSLTDTTINGSQDNLLLI